MGTGEMYKSIIISTARDYDMSPEEVKRILAISKDSEDYFNRLEQFIKDRRNA